MGRKRKGRAVNGVILIDKPEGMSSNHVVQRVKRAFQAQKAGHTGALDPLATGLLPVCLGEATKFSQFLLDADKAYFVTAKLGQRTNTSDADGEVVEESPVNITEQDIREQMPQFMGEIDQIPSMYSALKHEGRPLYHYARQGIHIDRPPRKITIHDLELLAFNKDEVSFNVKCSKGTYIRTLIDDLGQALGCGAHVKVLRRTQVGDFDSSEMKSLDFFDDFDHSEESFQRLDELLLPMDTSISSLDIVNVSEKQAGYFQQGRVIDVSEITGFDTINLNNKNGQIVRVYQQNKSLFLGIAELNEDKQLQAKRVVVYL